MTAEAPELVSFGLAVHGPDPGPKRLVTTRLLDRFGDTRRLQGLGGTVVHVGAFRDQAQNDPTGFGSIGRTEDVNAVRFEGRGGALHAIVVRGRAVTGRHRPIEI